MTKLEKLLQIFEKNPKTSIVDAMRRTGASRPMAYKARQKATAKGTKKKLIIHESEVEMAKRLGIPKEIYAAHAAAVEEAKGITRSQLVKELEPGLNALFNADYKGMAEEELQNENDQITSTLSARGERYGPFIGHAEVTRALKNVIHFYTVERKGSWQELDADMSEALDMIAHKIGRILNGDHRYVDSWIDIAGYAKLVADRLQGVTR